MANGSSSLGCLFGGIVGTAAVICLTISPIVLLLSMIGAIDHGSFSDIWPFVFFTLADFALLFWWAHSNRKRMIFAMIAVLVFATACITPGYIKHLKETRACNEALALIEQEKYEDALAFLLEYNDYSEFPSCTGLLYLCKAHVDYEEGNLEYAHNDIILHDCYTEPVFRTEKEEAFASTVRHEYNELQWKTAEKKRAAENAHREWIRSNVPYVGLSESEIDNTSLGRHYGDPVFGELYLWGKTYIASKYGFEENGRIIFVAYCADDHVLLVDDKRSGYSTVTVDFIPYTVSKKSSSSGSFYKGETYYDAEDFYDEYYDEFDSFEDAEDYFYDHVY